MHAFLTTARICCLAATQQTSQRTACLSCSVFGEAILWCHGVVCQLTPLESAQVFMNQTGLPSSPQISRHFAIGDVYCSTDAIYLVTDITDRCAVVDMVQPQTMDNGGTLRVKLRRVPKGWLQVGSVEIAKRSWTSDFNHENGRYGNLCSKCGKLFLGHKRRITCRTCI